MSKLLEIKNLHVSAEGKDILKGVDLVIQGGELHALMGPNGSGKSTLAQVIAGHPGFKITQGEILFEDKNILELAPDERARLGMFLAFQYPLAVPGVTLSNMLREAYNSVRKAKLTPVKFKKLVSEKLDILKFDESILERAVNDGLSGGEKKKAEVLQMLTLEPKLAVLDETDSGLDVDALKIVARGISKFVNGLGSGNPLEQRADADAARGDVPSPRSYRGLLLITHYQRILEYIKPDHVHVMVDGKIIKSGGPEIAHELEKSGYNNLVK